MAFSKYGGVVFFSRKGLVIIVWCLGAGVLVSLSFLVQTQILFLVVVF